LFSDSKQADTDVLSGNTDNLTDFFVRQVLKPEQDNRTIKGLQLGDTLVEHTHLPGVLIAVFKEIDVHGQPNCRGAPLFPVKRDAGIESDTVEPCPDITAMLKVFEPFP
jgi:hypothetical protein